MKTCCRKSSEDQDVLAVWISMGVAVGTAFFAATDNPALIGAGIGLGALVYVGRRILAR